MDEAVLEAMSVALEGGRDAPERYTVSPTAAVAFAGTGFDPDNPQHRVGSDAVRYAIMVQRLRDQKDYARSDRLVRHFRAMGYEVGTGPGRTEVAFRHRAMKRVNMPVVAGILYDSLT